MAPPSTAMYLEAREFVSANRGSCSYNDILHALTQPNISGVLMTEREAERFLEEAGVLPGNQPKDGGESPSAEENAFGRRGTR